MASTEGLSLHSLTGAEESPRISFSSDLFDESNFITICPNPQAEREREVAERARSVDFEFLSSNKTNMITADELIYQGKLIPFWEIHHAEKLNTISLKSDGGEYQQKIEPVNKEDSRITWFIDDDPSPRPPKCTVLWKELLKLKKQRPLTLSSSSSSSSSSTSSSSSAVDERKDSGRNRDKCSKKNKKAAEREKTRSVSNKVRPMLLNVPMCTEAKNAAALPPLFSLRKGRLYR